MSPSIPHHHYHHFFHISKCSSTTPSPPPTPEPPPAHPPDVAKMLEILHSFLYTRASDHESLEIRIMDDKDLVPATRLLAQSFMDSTWMPERYHTDVEYCVMEYFKEKSTVLPHAATLVGFYKEKWGGDDEVFAGIVDLSFDKQGLVGPLPTPDPPRDCPYVCNLTVKKEFRSNDLARHGKEVIHLERRTRKESEDQRNPTIALSGVRVVKNLNDNNYIPTKIRPLPKLNGWGACGKFDFTWKRKGIGWHLIKACEKLVRQMGLSQRVYLHCRVADKGPLALYKKAGYQIRKTDSKLLWLTFQRRKHLLRKDLSLGLGGSPSLEFRSKL